MAKTITVSYEGKPNYQIEIQKDFRLLPEMLKKLGYEGKKICVVSDSDVAKYYLAEVAALLTPVCSSCI